MTFPNLPLFPLRLRIEGTMLQMKPFPSYYQWIDVGDFAPMITSIVEDIMAANESLNLFELPFTHEATMPLFLVSVPPLATIIRVRLHIETPFDVTTAISVGDDNDAELLMNIFENLPGEIGVYETEPDYEYPELATLAMFVNAPGATAGAGKIVIEWQKE